LEAIGGVGKYQVIWYIIVVIGMLAGAFILYSLYYFSMIPDYNCLLGDDLINW